MGTDSIQQQWEAIKAAPVLYLAALIAVIATVWVINSFLFRHRLESKDERIALLKSQLESAQDELRRSKDLPKSDPLSDFRDADGNIIFDGGNASSR